MSPPLRQTRKAKTETPEIPPLTGLLERKASGKVRAHYGPDADNPTLWELIIAKEHLSGLARQGRKNGLAEALFVQAIRREGLRPLGGHLLLGFFESAAQAIVHNKPGFFREVVRLIEERIAKRCHPIDYLVHQALAMLQPVGKNELLPTKREVREKVKWLWAFEIVGARRKWDLFKDGRVWGSIRPEVVKEIEEQKDELPKQKWDRIWKRCDLSHLPSDRGGQPSHKARSFRR